MPTRALCFATGLACAAGGLASAARAQLVEAWSRSDSSFPVATLSVAPDGRNVIAGNWNTPHARALVRDAAGNTLANIAYDLGPNSTEHFQASGFAANGDVVLVGRVSGVPGGPNEFGVANRYDTAGGLVWSRSFPPLAPNGYAGATHVLLAPNGDAVVAGVESWGIAVVWRLDPLGNVLWSGRTSTGSVDFPVKALADAPNGDIVVAGLANENIIDNDSDLFVARFSVGGSLAWSRNVPGGQGRDAATSVAVDGAGRTFVAGRRAVSTGPGGTTFESVLLAYAPDGMLLWTRTTPSPSGTQVAIDAHGDVLFLSGGYALGYDLRKYDTSGNLQWSVSRGASSAFGFLVEAGDDVLVYGSVPAPPYMDGLAVRYDRAGTTRWTTIYDLPGPDTAEEFRRAGVDASGILYVHDAIGVLSSVRRFDQASRSICFGDGSATACPCGNESAPGDQSGCLHSLGVGARLQSAGQPSLSNDSVRLDVTSATNASVLFFQGDSATAGGAGAVFGDGLRCAGGNIVRIATRTANLGAVSYPAGPGDAAVSVRGSVAAPGTRWYQAWFRNSASFCTPATFNTTNGVAIDWSM
jgi:hypothetical protein